MFWYHTCKFFFCIYYTIKYKHIIHTCTYIIRSSVSFLLVLLAHHKLPESFQPLFSSPYDNIITRQFPFRSFLLHYLLPNPAHTQSILSGGIDTFPRVTNRFFNNYTVLVYFIITHYLTIGLVCVNLCWC